MPTATFDNLPEEKRKAFVEACLEEFALNDYENASISRIVKRLKIAKGSVYQYFEDKKALYFYLKQIAEQRKMQYVLGRMSQGGEFWQMFEELYEAGIRFDLENPLHSGFLYTLSQQRFHPGLGVDLVKEGRQRSAEVLRMQLANEVAKGSMRADIDLDVLSYMLIQASIGIGEYLSFKYGIDFRANIQAGKPVFALSEKELKSTVKQLIAVLKTGFSI